MLRQRIISGLALGLPALAMIIAGGVWITLLVLAVSIICVIEFAHLVARRGHRASSGLMILWVILFIADRYLPDMGLLLPGSALLIILTLAWALVRYRQGTANAATGFAMTLAGSFYIGWTIAHFISLRALDDGLFWVLTVLFATWGADTGAYLVGRTTGRTLLIQDVSPHKTWEGYLGGIVMGTGLSVASTLAWRALGASTMMSPLHGLMIGVLASSIGPLGDLGISMFKRYASAKDTSGLIPGHGGFLDRVDSILVTILLGYYYLTLLVL